MDRERAKQYEISVSLFNKCNLSCEFCFERHDRDIDFEELDQVAYKCYEATKKDIEKYNPKKLVLRFWGGELLKNCSVTVLDARNGEIRLETLGQVLY